MGKLVVSELRRFEMFNDIEKDFSPKPVAFCDRLLLYYIRRNYLSE